MTPELMDPTGEVTYPPPSMQELFDADMMALVRAVNRYISARRTLVRRGNTPSEQAHVERAFEALSAAADQADPWFDDNDDPRSMGWVDDRGRP
jgi:hypothetical protein